MTVHFRYSDRSFAILNARSFSYRNSQSLKCKALAVLAEHLNDKRNVNFDKKRDQLVYIFNLLCAFGFY